MENEVRISRHNIDYIPVLSCFNQSPQKKIPVILLHKILCDKETELKIAYHLAQHNYYVIIPDLLGHGEHEDSLEKNNNLDFDNFFTKVPKFMNMIELIVDYICHNLKNIVVPEYITAVGTSYGGFLALVAGYWFQTIRYIVAMNTSGNFSKVMERDSFEMFRLYSSKRPVIDRIQVKQIIGIYDPISNIEKYGNKHLFIMNGALDTTFSKNEIIPFVDMLKETYKKNGYSERIIHRIYARAGHDVNNQMIQDLIHWLDCNIGIMVN